MIKCSHCGALQDDDALFCTSCGTKIEIGRHCVHCGALIDEDSLFCSSCGGRQDDGHNTSEESPSHPLPQSVPPVQSQQDVPVEPPSEDEVENDDNIRRKTYIIIACIVAVLLLCLGGWIAYQKLSSKDHYEDSDEDDDDVEMADERTIDDKSQKLLSLATFEAPQRLITANSGKVNVKPEPKANAYAKDKINDNTLYKVIGEEGDWFYIDYYDSTIEGSGSTRYKNCGYVSKSETHESPITPLGDYHGYPVRYEENEKENSVYYEYLSKTGSSQFPYVMVRGTDKDLKVYMELFLGKIIGNVLVFKYPVKINMRFARQGYKGEDVIDGNTIIFSPDYDSKSITHYHRYGLTVIYDFSEYTDKQFEAIFGSAIKKYEEMTTDHMCSEEVYFTDEWVKRKGY